jgi:hypothetical protein
MENENIENKNMLKKKRKRLYINKKKSLYPKFEFLLSKLQFYPKVKENNRADQNQKLKKYSNQSPIIFEENK